MSFTSLYFFVFLMVTMILYNVIPLRVRWLVLLIASIVFYVTNGWESVAFILLTGLIAYIGSITIEDSLNSVEYALKGKTIDKTKAKQRMIFAIILVLVVLLYFKFINNSMASICAGFSIYGVDIQILAPLGISYYTFSVIGYMADVYWRKDNAEREFFKFLLYMIYFPHIVQGPIPRHKRLTSELIEGHRFEYNRFCFGVQRIVWGYFKKLVIADRFAIIVKAIYGNTTTYNGQYYIVAILLSTIQLYSDFSGCMDIALGISECFGITLDENFKRPFFSKNTAEFWRRWHITLGTWFKDYVYMPLVINPKLISLSKKVKDKFGIRAGKSVMTIIPLAVVWILTGLWHGTGWDYIIWGCYFGTIIIVSTVFAPEFKRLNDKLHINTDSRWWHAFQIIRTTLIFCGGRMITGPGDIKVVWYMIKSLFTNFNPWIWLDQSLFTLGVSRRSFEIGILGLVLLWFISAKQEKGIHIRESIATWPLLIRWTVYYALFFAVIVFGIYGPGYDASSFVYMNF